MMLESNIGYEQYLSSYKYFLARKMTSKSWSKYRWLMHYLESRCGPMATVTSLKLTWNENPDQAF